MYFINFPFFLRLFYKNVTFNGSRERKCVYLTFDDGPIPEVTPTILDILSKHNVKATFFCVGENINKNSLIYQRIIDEGHQVGNHTYNHLKGWETSNDDYLKNIHHCEELTKSKLFRPPYGRAKRSQLKLIQKTHKIIYWDVLSGDFDQKITAEKCYRNVIKYTRNGSIIVFHDNIKAIPRVTHALPRVIDYLKNKGYNFETL